VNNQKIEKVKAEIDRTKAKVLEFQAKLRALERQKIELENERIVALVRGEHISDAELDALMKSFRREELAEDAVSEEIKKEDTQNAIISEN
jgi:hypothetical protein